MAADIEKLEKMEAPDLQARTQCEGGDLARMGEFFLFPVADGKLTFRNARQQAQTLGNGVTHPSTTQHNMEQLDTRESTRKEQLKTNGNN